MRTIEQILKDFEESEWEEPDWYSDVSDLNVLVKYAFLCFASEDLDWLGPNFHTLWDLKKEELAKHGISIEMSGGNHDYIYAYITKPDNKPVCKECEMPFRDSWKSRHSDKGCRCF